MKQTNKGNIIMISHLALQNVNKDFILFFPQVWKEGASSCEKSITDFVKLLTDWFHLGFLSAALAFSHCTVLLEVWYPISKMSNLFSFRTAKYYNSLLLLACFSLVLHLMWNWIISKGKSLSFWGISMWIGFVCMQVPHPVNMNHKHVCLHLWIRRNSDLIPWGCCRRIRIIYFRLWNLDLNQNFPKVLEYFFFQTHCYLWIKGLLRWNNWKKSSGHASTDSKFHWLQICCTWSPHTPHDAHRYL